MEINQRIKNEIRKLPKTTNAQVKQKLMSSAQMILANWRNRKHRSKCITVKRKKKMATVARFADFSRCQK